jgi:hypothetical protein
VVKKPASGSDPETKDPGHPLKSRANFFLWLVAGMFTGSINPAYG